VSRPFRFENGHPPDVSRPVVVAPHLAPVVTGAPAGLAARLVGAHPIPDRVVRDAELAAEGLVAHDLQGALKLLLGGPVDAGAACPRCPGWRTTTRHRSEPASPSAGPASSAGSAPRGHGSSRASSRPLRRFTPSLSRGRRRSSGPLGRGGARTSPPPRIPQPDSRRITGSPRGPAAAANSCIWSIVQCTSRGRAWPRAGRRSAGARPLNAFTAAHRSSIASSAIAERTRRIAPAPPQSPGPDELAIPSVAEQSGR
jgi:hypothetical protein